MPYTGFMAAGGLRVSGDDLENRSPSTSAPATRSAGRSPPRTAPRPRCSCARTEPPTSPACCSRSTAGTWPDDGAAPSLDRERIRELFDLRNSIAACSGRRLHRRPPPRVARAARDRAGAPGHRRTSSPGIEGDAVLPRPARARPSRTSRPSATPPATRPTATTRSSPRPPASSTPTARSATSRACSRMGGAQHRRYRALVQPSFVPAKAQWWIDEVDRGDRRRPDRRVRRRGSGRAQRRLLRRHPGAHDHRQLRHRRRPGPRRPRRACATRPRVAELVDPIVAGPPGRPAGRPDQRAGAGRDHRRGRRDPPPHRRRDPLVRLPAARGRIGHDLEADGHHAGRAARPARRARRRARRPQPAARRPSRSRCAGSRPTRCSPAGSREDTELHGVEIPKGSVLHLCLGLGQPRPRAVGPARRVRHPPAAEADVRLRRRSAHLPRHARRPGRDDGRHRRPARPAARPAARPRRQPPPQTIGFYERGVTEIPVVFG